MANLCSNVMVIYGPAADVKNFGKIVERAYTEYKTCGKFFVDTLFKICGYDAEPSNGAYDLDIDYAYEPDGDGESHIKFYFDTKWSPMYEDFESFLAAKFPTLKQVTLADEFGCDVHVNTDSRRKYFPWNYAASYEVEDGDGGDECFKTLDDAETFFHETFGADVPFSRDYDSDEKCDYFHVYDYEAM